MADDFVQVAVDGTGKKVDASLLTNTAGVPVERQRIVQGDAVSPDSFARITGAGQILVREDRYFESAYIAALDAQAALGRSRGTERFSPTDRRGGGDRGSTR